MLPSVSLVAKRIDRIEQRWRRNRRAASWSLIFQIGFELTMKHQHAMTVWMFSQNTVYLEGYGRWKNRLNCLPFISVLANLSKAHRETTKRETNEGEKGDRLYHYAGWTWEEMRYAMSAVERFIRMFGSYRLIIPMRWGWEWIWLRTWSILSWNLRSLVFHRRLSQQDSQQRRRQEENTYEWMI